MNYVNSLKVENIIKLGLRFGPYSIGFTERGNMVDVIITLNCRVLSTHVRSAEKVSLERMILDTVNIVDRFGDNLAALKQWKIAFKYEVSLMDASGLRENLNIIFDSIVAERIYQRQRWGVEDENGQFYEVPKTVGEFLVYMHNYLDEAFRMATSEVTDEKTLDMLRKVVALGVACFEQHGIPARELTEVVNKREPI